MAGIPSFKLADMVNYPKQATIYPGSLTYEVAKFMLTNRLSSPGALWFTNVSPLVEKHGRKPVLRAIASLRSRYGLDVRKPTNHHFDRPNVWQVSNPERVRFPQVRSDL